MKGIDMFYLVKTMLDLGKSISFIARTYGIDRKTLKKIRNKIQSGDIVPPVIERKSALDNYRDCSSPMYLS